MALENLIYDNPTIENFTKNVNLAHSIFKRVNQWDIAPKRHSNRKTYKCVQ